MLFRVWFVEGFKYMYKGPIETKISIYNSIDNYYYAQVYDFYLTALFDSEATEYLRKTNSFLLWQQRPD